MLLASVVGIVLPLGLLAWTVLMRALFSDSSMCGEYTGCLGYLVVAWQIGRWIAVVLAWPLLYLLRVRPAWPVAVLAAFLLVAIWRLAEALSGFGDLFTSILISGILILSSGVIAYPLTALVTSPILRWPWRALHIALSAGLYVVAMLAN
ncbi:hypothetical protein GCM10009530_47600 [Microbispora corallina]|uniref:Uncharacterized protein n=1 Tax=Microbispora corallina TaxID=83302 RepID=A0ABQ4G5Q3_9ACTN|nr:hypothetical protein [Microbispora corallina]GIH42335.1 hypothetical protein Mco01_53350 [Microbispora corallina]